MLFKIEYLSKLYRDRRGVFSILTAIILPLIVVIATAGFEFLRVYNARLNSQYIADSAAFAAILDAASQDPEANAIDYMNEAFKNMDFVGASLAKITLKKLEADLDDDREGIKVGISATVETPFLKLANVDEVDYYVTAHAKTECQPYEAEYLGDADFDDDTQEYVLTPDKYYKYGWVWLNKKFDLTLRQDIRLRFNFGTRNADGADGMAFSMHNDLSGNTAQGQVGESLGVAWHPAYEQTEAKIVAPAVVVEFDTWRNGFNSDPVNDHTAVFTIGNAERDYNADNAYLQHGAPNELVAKKTLTNIENGEYYHVRFIWDPDTEELIYFFDGTKIGQVKFDVIDFLGTDEATLGFSASTGGARNRQTVCFSKVMLD